MLSLIILSTGHHDFENKLGDLRRWQNYYYYLWIYGISRSERPRQFPLLGPWDRHLLTGHLKYRPDKIKNCRREKQTFRGFSKHTSWLFLLTVFPIFLSWYWPLFSCLSTLDSWWLLDYPAVNCFIRIIGPPASWSLVIVNGYKILSQPTFNKNWNISRGSIPTHFNKLEFTHGARSRFRC